MVLVRDLVITEQTRTQWLIAQLCFRLGAARRSAERGNFGRYQTTKTIERRVDLDIGPPRLLEKGRYL